MSWDEKKIRYRCSRSVCNVLFHGQNGPWNSTVHTDLDSYTEYMPSQLVTNTSGCCYSLYCSWWWTQRESETCRAYL